MPKCVNPLEIISGPRPAPALSAGSILSDNIFSPLPVDDSTPAFHLNGDWTPVDPYLKFINESLLNSSMKDELCWATVLSVAVMNRIRTQPCFLFRMIKCKKYPGAGIHLNVDSYSY